MNSRWYESFNRINKVKHELQGDWEPDWDNLNEVKIEICYFASTEKLSINPVYTRITSPIHFKSKSVAWKIIDMCYDDLLVIFGVEGVHCTCGKPVKWYDSINDQYLCDDCNEHNEGRE